MDVYDIYKSLGSKTKSNILAHLYTCKCANGSCVNDLMEIMKTSQPNISKHLGQLKSSGILVEERDGKQKFYKINDKLDKKYLDIMNEAFKDEVFDSAKCKCNLGG